MNVTWMIVGIGICAAMVSMLRWSHWHDRRCELGYMSDRWVADQRLSRMRNEP